MKMKMPSLLLALVLSLALAIVPAGAELMLAKYQTMTEVLAMLENGDYAGVYARFSDDTKALVTEGDLATAWESIVQSIGRITEIGQVEEAQQDGLTILQAPVYHESGMQDTLLVLDAQDKIVALNIHPETDVGAAPAAVEDTYDYAAHPLPDGATEEAVTLRAGAEDASGGTLTLPAGEGPFTAVLLVHAMGENDRDETVLGIKPFRDIAIGLAAQGIATLRYDKYTYAHPGMISQYPSLEEEYLRDFDAALSLLAGDDRIEKIYVLGHGEGGNVVPLLLERADGAAGGGILLGGSPRALWELEKSAIEVSIEGGEMTEEQVKTMQTYIEGEMEKVQRLPEMTEEELDTELIFAYPARFQHDMMYPGAIETAKALALPLLILHSEADWQLSTALDYTPWIEGLEGTDLGTFILYPDLTHLFTAYEGEVQRSTDDFVAGSHVSQQVIDDIAAWLLDVAG